MSFAPARIWQLTDAQYVNVVRDVFGIELEGNDARIVSPVVPETYTNYSEATLVGGQVAPNYERAAARVGERVVQNADEIVGSANPSTPELQEFISTKIARAWRRPLDPSEVEAFTAIYNGALPDAATGLRLVLQAALQAPSFLYRTELGQGAATATGPVQLTAFEIASALSFGLYDSAPDETLWAKAQDGSLMDPAARALEVDRLLELPVVQANLTKKASYWLGLETMPSKEKSRELYPDFSDSLRDSLYESVQAFLREVLWTGTMTDLFTSARIYTNEQLSDAYSLPDANGQGLNPVFVSERSAGILTQPGFLAAANKWADRGDPIHRGLFLFESFICGGQIPEPPADAIGVGEEMSGSEREKVDKRAVMPQCGICHSMFDPIGLTFERYDAMGRYSETRYGERDPETGVTEWKTSPTPIDDTAVLPEALGPEFAGPVSGVHGLAEKLAGQTARVARCSSRRLAEYTLGYNAEVQNTCELESVRAVFESSGSFVEFFRALAKSQAFVTRNPIAQ